MEKFKYGPLVWNSGGDNDDEVSSTLTFSTTQQITIPLGKKHNVFVRSEMMMMMVKAMTTMMKY